MKGICTEDRFYALRKFDHFVYHVLVYSILWGTLSKQKYSSKRFEETGGFDLGGFSGPLIQIVPKILVDIKTFMCINFGQKTVNIHIHCIAFVYTAAFWASRVLG